MNPSFANLELDDGEHENDTEEDDGGGGCQGHHAIERCQTDVVINIEDDRFEVDAAGGAGRNDAGRVNDGDNRGICFERPNDGGDQNIEDHRRNQRDSDARERPHPIRAVDLRCLVILFVDSLNTGKENNDFKGESIPNAVNQNDRHRRPIGGSGGDPRNRIAAKPSDDLIGKTETCRILNRCGVTAEHESEDKADRDRIRDIWQEENRLVKSLERFDRIEGDRDHQAKQDCDGYRNENNDPGVAHCLQKVRMTDDGRVVAKECIVVKFTGLDIVSGVKRDHERVEDRVKSEDRE